VLLKWFCRTCAGEWPMTEAERQLIERQIQSKVSAGQQAQDEAICPKSR